VDCKNQNKVVFSSKHLSLDLRYAVDDTTEEGAPAVDIGIMDLRQQGHLGLGVYSEFALSEGQAVTFIMRTPPKVNETSSGKPTRQQSEQAGIPLEG
jgi:hypothetical protein